MRACLDTLRPRDTHGLKAAFLRGYTYTELARAASVPTGTMKSRIRRALLQLRDRMEASEIDYRNHVVVFREKADATAIT